MSYELIVQKYQNLCKTQSDINEHLPILKKYAQQSDVVIEFGVRWIVSTWAFLAAKPNKLISYDYYDPSHWGANITEPLDYAKQANINFEFILADTRKITIPNCDLLFIDTLHEYEQLKEELKLHAKNVNKYIIFHDTISFRLNGEQGGKGIYYAIEEFLQKNKNWNILEEYTNNNGLLILEKK